MFRLGPAPSSLISLISSLFLLCSFGMLAQRQLHACLRMYVFQACLLAAAAVVVWHTDGSVSLLAFSIVTVLGKVVLVPSVLRRLVPKLYLLHREIDQTISISLALLTACVLTIFAGAVMYRLASGGLHAADNIEASVGLAAFLIGLFMLFVRKEAIPQLIAILALENAVFLCGLAVAPTFPIFVEIGLTLDLLILVVVVSLMTHMMYEQQGTTDTSTLNLLGEKLP